ncbi:phosphatidylinositol glycan anchor biosynthesis class Q isoform X2 [Dermatophagoides pteronyssinus]|uniref:phosphatidylinositol glycan anchor biosynthesis class Q isoform X2 n=1 Tax=Dermatophagoides pteronyssinus TaxID=6956 RepID=UPI003F673D22
MDQLEWINIFIPDRLTNMVGNDDDDDDIMDGLLFGHYERSIDGHGFNVSITAVTRKSKSLDRQSIKTNDVIDNLVCLGRMNLLNHDCSDTGHMNGKKISFCSIYMELNLLYKTDSNNDNENDNHESLPFDLKSIRIMGKPFTNRDKVSFILYDTYRLMRCQSFDIYRPGNRIEFLSFVLRSLYDTSIVYENKKQIKYENSLNDYMIESQLSTTFIYHYAQAKRLNRSAICDERFDNCEQKTLRSPYLILYLFWLFDLMDMITFHKSLFIAQLKFRLLQIRYIWNLMKQSPSKQSLSLGNLLFAIIFDHILGILATWLIFKYTNQSHLMQLVDTNVGLLVNKINNMLVLLQSMPAGLKLNQPFNDAISQVMFYHIYLWQNYMLIFQSLFPAIMIFAFYFGIFGITFTISLLCDLFNMITIHIYCFYGYTSRVYNFQSAGIISLWRLFRGKKYNPLRDRIDSYSYENVHLFIGTILFTVFIFLLPTVLMYYVVMLIFRLITIAIKQSQYLSILYGYGLSIRK